MRLTGLEELTVSIHATSGPKSTMKAVPISGGDSDTRRTTYDKQSGSALDSADALILDMWDSTSSARPGLAVTYRNSQLWHRHLGTGSR